MDPAPPESVEVKLPPELEPSIFEMAASVHRRDAPGHLVLHSNKKLQAHELAALGALRSLSGRLHNLFCGPVILGHAVFRNITHLESWDTAQDTVPWAQLMSRIPHLTHLAFRQTWVAPQFVGALGECPRMEALVFLSTTLRARGMAWRQYDEVRYVRVMVGG
ncbi:hypothetical protein C8R43DRAFT_1051388 [Mycena crocata]|nr:hypothetical protein C8R43DRAFT_1051388 [Mycena crocata]